MSGTHLKKPSILNHLVITFSGLIHQTMTVPLDEAQEIKQWETDTYCSS